MGDVVAFIEHRDGVIRPASREVATAASALAASLGGRAVGVALGGSAAAERLRGSDAYGLSTLFVGGDDLLERYSAESYTAAVVAFARDRGASAVVFAASATGKDLAPRVAAGLDTPLATDVTELTAADGRVVVTRPVFAGKAFARLRFDSDLAVVSIRPNVFQASERGGAVDVEAFVPELSAAIPGARFVKYEGSSGDALDVSEATIVVSGGRGMKGPDEWNLLEDLKSALGDGVALGASRAVVDAGWRPHGEQVGQTGKTVSPNLYFAIGISGAIQHLAGMRTSGTIVAINKDPDAPIFSVADYGVVGDLFEIVPKLAEEIRRVRA